MFRARLSDGSTTGLYRMLRPATVTFSSTYRHVTNASMPAMLGRVVARMPAGASVERARVEEIGATMHRHADCVRRGGFELSLVRDRNGRPTALAAAAWFAQHGAARSIPQAGWRLISERRRSATLASHATVLHAVQGSDGTWQVDSGSTCASG